MAEQILLAPLRKALTSLQIALKQEKNEFVRDAVIQRFEYTFKLSWKLLKRYLTQAIDLEEISIRNMFREAGKLGLIEDVEAWLSYHRARNLTSHTYNEDTAEETYNVAKQFANDADKLLQQLEKVCGP